MFLLWLLLKLIKVPKSVTAFHTVALSMEAVWILSGQIAGLVCVLRLLPLYVAQLGSCMIWASYCYFWVKYNGPMVDAFPLPNKNV